MPRFVLIQRKDAACVAKIAEEVVQGWFGKEIVKGQEIAAGGLPQKPSRQATERGHQRFPAHGSDMDCHIGEEQSA
jgi:hypothetical protein